MSKNRPTAVITGTGMYVPPKIVLNADLEKVMETSDEWIRQRSGIEQRHVVEGIGTSDLALEASKIALDTSGLHPAEIDLIILATLSPDHQFPGSSALLQHKLGLETTPAIDIRCQCSGFIYSLNLAKLFIEAGQYRKVLVVGAEAHSPILDFTTRGRDVAVLFGDGAGAVVMEASNTAPGLGAIVLHTQGQFADKLWIERPGTSKDRWITESDLLEGRCFPQMEGRYVFKHAVERLREVVLEVLAKDELSISDIDHFLFHQANLRINEKVSELLMIPNHKVHSNIQKYGNCSAASIPMLLDETVRRGKIKRGEKVLAAAFGAGFTWAASIFTY